MDSYHTATPDLFIPIYTNRTVSTVREVKLLQSQTYRSRRQPAPLGRVYGQNCFDSYPAGTFATGKREGQITAIYLLSFCGRASSIRAPE